MSAEEVPPIAPVARASVAQYPVSTELYAAISASVITPAFKPAEPGLSKLNSVRKTDVEVDVIPGEPAARRPKPSRGPAPAGVRAPASLERR